MYLSREFDYSIKILIYLSRNKEKIFTVEDLHKELSIPEHTLRHTILNLAKNNLVVSRKGRTGGFKFNSSPKDIKLGEIVRITEEHLNDKKFFSKGKGDSYKIFSSKYNDILIETFNTFINNMSKYTLEDLL